MQREIHKLSVNRVDKKLVPSSKGQLWMNEPQLKGPYGRFVNAHTLFILRVAKYSALNLKDGPRGMLHRTLHTFLKHFCFVDNKN